MINKYILMIGLGALFFQSCSKTVAPWDVIEQENGILILENKDSVLFYQRTTKSLDGNYPRANYIHPLYSLDNTRISEDFPEDHLHHRGVFWAWHQNYIGSQSVGDAWALENFSWQVKDLQTRPYPDFCILQTDVFWESPLWLDDQGKPEPFVNEKATITIHATKDNYRIIDYHIELQALEDSLFIGGSEDEKGYSGFSWRIPLPDDVTFRGAEGKVQPQTLALDAGPWMDISGNLDGRAGAEGVLVIDHPDNPDHPQPWILRSSRSMQNAAYPGREKVMIPKDTPLVLKYRMVVYKNEIGNDEIGELMASEW